MKAFLLLLPLFLFAGESEPALPSSIRSAREAYDARAKKLQEDFLRAIQAEQIKVLKAYDDELKKFKLTKEEEALQEQIIKAEKEEVRTALMAVASQKVKDSLLLAVLKQRFLEEQAVMSDSMGNFYTPKDRIDEEGIVKELSGKTFSFSYTKGKPTGSFTLNADFSVTWVAPEIPTKWEYAKGILKITHTTGDFYYEARVSSRELFTQVFPLQQFNGKGKTQVVVFAEAK